MPPIIPQPNAQLTLFSLTKTCKGCGLEKPTTEYHKSSNPCGFTSRCKSCHYAQVQAKRMENHEENKAKARDKARDKYQEDPETHREKVRQWRLNNPDRSRELDRASEARNKEQRQAHRAATKGLRKVYYKTYCKTHLVQLAQYRKVYYKANSHRLILKAHARRRVYDPALDTLTGPEWKQILVDQGGLCAKCKSRFNSKLPPTRDHILPSSKGGYLTKENSQGLCRGCNSSKGTKTIRY